MTRSTASAFVGVLSLAALPILASCDSGPGGGDRWSCATVFLGSAEGQFFDEPTQGNFTAILRARDDVQVEDFEIEAGEEVWLFEGQYEEVEGPFDEDEKLRDFTAVVQDDGTVLPIIDDEELGSNFALSGSIDLENCAAEGTWDFSGPSEGTWQARP